MLFEHLDPTRRIPLYTQLFVVNASIMVRLSILEHGKNNAQHLVRQRDDRLLVTLADVEGIKFVFEGTSTSAGSLGKLAQQTPHPGIALSLIHISEPTRPY